MPDFRAAAMATLLMTLTASAPSSPADDLASWMEGTFDNQGQVARLASSPAPGNAPGDRATVKMRLVAVPPGKLTGTYRYVEQALAGKESEPYRQRFYRLEDSKDGSVLIRTFEIREASLRTALVGAPAESLAAVTPDALIPVADARLQHEGPIWVGGTVQPALSEFRGAATVTSQISIGPDFIYSLDRGYGRDGRQVFGPEDGLPYEFHRDVTHYIKATEADRDAESREWAADPFSPLKAGQRLPVPATGELALTSPADKLEATVRLDGANFVITTRDGSPNLASDGGGPRVGRLVLPAGQRFLLGTTGFATSNSTGPTIVAFTLDAATQAKFLPLPNFPPDPRYRFFLPLKPLPAAADAAIDVDSTRQVKRAGKRVGTFEVPFPSGTETLTAIRLFDSSKSDEDFSLFFTDATNGEETYPGGRFLEAPKLADGRYLVDFNLCYNPLCGYSKAYNCPVPPKENHLKGRVEAGRKYPKGAHGED